jgi:hypothetical protein
MYVCMCVQKKGRESNEVLVGLTAICHIGMELDLVGTGAFVPNYSGFLMY